jgi:predicted dehydrogenase
MPAILRAEGCELAAVASRKESALKECTTRFPGLRQHLGYERLLADPEIDAVYIPLPNSLHCEWTIRAAKAGKHVLCEKPLALNAGECREMIAACERNKVLLMEAFMYRYSERTRRVVEVLKSGVLGEIKSVTSCFRYLNSDPNSINWKSSLGGGSLYDVGCYPVNFVGLVADIAAGVPPGGAEPDLVTGAAVLVEGVDAIASGIFRYPHGLMATVHCGFNAHRQVVSTVVGTEGVLEIKDTFMAESGSITLTRGKTSELIEIAGSDRYRPEVEDFAAAIREKRPPIFSLDETVRNMKVLDRLLASLGM